MDMRKKLEVMDQIKEANKRHVEEWKTGQPEAHNFFFTFGSDPRYPFGRDDYVVVEAADEGQARALFRLVHPNRPGSEFINCASVYEENQFAGIKEEYYKDVFPAEIISLRVIRQVKRR